MLQHKDIYFKIFPILALVLIIYAYSKLSSGLSGNSKRDLVAGLIIGICSFIGLVLWIITYFKK